MAGAVDALVAVERAGLSSGARSRRRRRCSRRRARAPAPAAAPSAARARAAGGGSPGTSSARACSPASPARPRARGAWPPTRGRTRSRRAAAVPPPRGTGTAAGTSCAGGPRASAWSTPAGWPTDRTTSRLTRSRCHQRHRPRDAGTPVMADDVRPLDVQRVQNRDRVRDAVAHAVGAPRRPACPSRRSPAGRARSSGIRSA